MRCDDARAALLEARYAAREPATEVATHLASCAECQRFAAAEPKLDALLAAREAHKPSAEFDARFFARLTEQRGREANTAGERAGVRRVRTRVVMWIAPLAAAAALGLFFAWPKPKPSATAAATEDVAIAKDLELVEALPMLEHLEEAEAYETLANVDLDELKRMETTAP